MAGVNSSVGPGYLDQCMFTRFQGANRQIFKMQLSHHKGPDQRLGGIADSVNETESCGDSEAGVRSSATGISLDFGQSNLVEQGSLSQLNPL